MSNFKFFESTPVHGGIQYQHNFDNGYGVSIVRHSFSYGNGAGLWELAVLCNGNLCYDTPITDDVLGDLTEKEVDEIVEQVKALPNAG